MTVKMPPETFSAPRAASPIKDGREFIPEPYRDVAKGMEKQFAEFMLQEMHKTVSDTDTSTGMDYYKSLMTSEQAEQLINKESGLGIQQVILDQIYPQNMRSEFAYNQYKAQLAQATQNKPSMIRLEKDAPTETDIKISIEKATGVTGHE